MRNQNDETKVGALALTIILLLAVLAVCASMAVGLHFGAAWGWAVMAAFVLVMLTRCCIVFRRAMAASKDGHNFGRKDG